MGQRALRLEILMEGSSRPAVVPCVIFPYCACPQRSLILAACSPPVASKHDTVWITKHGAYDSWTCFATGKESNVGALTSGTLTMVALRIFEVGMEV